MNQTVEPVEVRTKSHLKSIPVGQTVSKSGKVGVYAGLESMWYGGAECKTLMQLPVIVYVKEGRVLREVIQFLDEPALRIHGCSILEFVDPNDRFYGYYKSLLGI